MQHWRHNTCEALMSEIEVGLLWHTLAARFVHMNSCSRYVQLLANHGVRSGGSLPHPLSQLLGLPVVPGEQLELFSVALNYWRHHEKRCVFEDILSKTLSHVGDGANGDRVLMQNEHMVAFVPHAQERKNEMWIMPRRQCHSFAEVTKEEVGALALACRSCLKMLYACLDDPDYNILMRTSPANTSDQLGDEHTEPMALWYRWHLVIIPHDNEWAWGGIKGLGGFTEVQGTPEQHAAELREYSTTLLTTSSRLDEIDEQAPAPVPEEQQPKARSVRFDQVRQMYCLFRYFPGCTAKRSRGISADWSYPLVWCAI